MEHLEIAAYRARPGMRTRLKELSQSRLPIFKRLGYVTDRSAQHWTDREMLIELLEWADNTSARARKHPDVRALDYALAEVSDEIPLDEVPEVDLMINRMKTTA